MAIEIELTKKEINKPLEVISFSYYPGMYEIKVFGFEGLKDLPFKNLREIKRILKGKITLIGIEVEISKTTKQILKDCNS